VRDGDGDDDVNPSTSQRVFGFGGCCGVKLGFSRVSGAEARAGGAEGVGVGFGKANSMMFKSLSVFVFVGLIVGWAEPLVILGAEGVIEIP
jgi:hypothetical protein